MIDNLFKSIIEVQSCSGRVERMTQLIVSISKSFGATVKIDNGNVYVTKGKPKANGYPCMVAHTDTVHDIVPDNEYNVGYDTSNGIIYGYNPVKRNFTGIGGDDKVGIYIALVAVRDFDSIKAAFFRDEEIGCVGSGLADLTFFSDCMYALQCDRRGNRDFINNISGTDISSADFQQDISDIISRHNYAFTKGMTTDVGKLTSLGVGISCANMSCGYYNPHQPEEIIVVDDVNNCKDMVYEIIYSIDKKYPHTPPPNPVYSGKDYYGNKYNFGSFYDESKVEPKSYKLFDDNDFAHMDFPFEDELINMTDADIYDYCIATFFGYNYIGNGVYQYEDEQTLDCVYQGKADMDLPSLETLLDEEELHWIFEQAEQIEQQRDYLVSKSKTGCVCCGTKKIGEDSKLFYDGMCYQCHNQKVFGW
jgi:tripeptide aminopeptidase